MKTDLNFKARAGLFKALGHPSRLLMFNLILLQPRHTEELANIMDLSPGTVSHHLSLLQNAGLLSSKKEQYYQIYSVKDELLHKPFREIISVPQPSLETNVSQDAYTTKVLKTFFKRGRLTKIPMQQKKLLVILDELIGQFEPGRRYSEAEVNEILADTYPDFATLRRRFIEFGYMTRSRDGTNYQRITE